MIELASVFAGGILGSAHCVGMCGGFAAAIGASGQPFWPVLVRQLVYSLGRICTYAFLGAVGGYCGLFVSQFKTPLLGVQQVFSILAGVIMLYVGLSVLGVIRFRWGPASGAAELLSSLFARFLNARGWFGFFSAGLATGFLPCGLVYSFLALAVSSGRLETGMVLMACFGLGTVPAMVLVGCGSKVLTYGLRKRIYQAAACLVIVLGLVTIVRGLPRDGHHSDERAVSTRIRPYFSSR